MSGNVGSKRSVENLNKLNKFRQLDVTVPYSSGKKNEKYCRSSGSYPDLQSKIRSSKNLLRHDPDLKKSAPLTSLLGKSIAR